MTPPVVGPDLRAKLIEADLNAGMCAVCLTLDPLKYDIEPENCERCAAVRVDAIVAELMRAGWRNMAVRDLSDTITFAEAVAAVRDADQAQANMGQP